MKRSVDKKIAVICSVAILALAGCGSIDSTEGYIGEKGLVVPIVLDSISTMNVADIEVVEMGNSPLTIDFNAVDPSATFMLVTGTSSPDEAASFSINDQLQGDVEKALSSDKGTQPETAVESYGSEEIFSSWLRASERELAKTMPTPGSEAQEGSSMGVSVKDVGASARTGVGGAVPHVGDLRSFRVLNSMISTTEYASVRARARCTNSSLALFVDLRVEEQVLSTSKIQEICDTFDDIARWEFQLLGSTSDINRDGVVNVLITPQINLLSSTPGQIVGGYFYAADLYARSEQNPTSDEQEIIYALAPDPYGDYGTTIPMSYYHEVLPAIMAHELQHAINYNQHVFVNNGEAEESWLNEGMSHLVEDIAGYGNNNPKCYSVFFQSPSTTPLVAGGSPSIEQRGAAYLFLRYLFEQSEDGEAFIGRLVQSGSSGIENIEQAFVGSDDAFDEFPEFMARWTAALALGSLGLESHSGYAYMPRATDARTGNWKGAVFRGNAEDGNGTTLNGIHTNAYNGSVSASLASSSAAYFSLDSITAQINLQATGDSNFAVLIRTR